MSTPEIDVPRHRLTVDEYYRMADLGILAPDARVELIEGEIIDMPPQGSPHAAIVSRLTERFIAACGSSAMVRCQMPIRLGTRSEPEPDIAIVKRDVDYYRRAHPIANDVLLVIEISNTTLQLDRKIKIPLYARHRIPEAWLIEVQASCVHVFRNPQQGEYADISTADRPSILGLASMPAVRIDLSGTWG
jgi:Uma2 family endonuclease